MKLSKRDRGYLLSALEKAVEWDESLIDAHRVRYAKRNKGLPRKIVPAEYRPLVERCRRNIANYRRLSALLRTAGTAK